MTEMSELLEKLKQLDLDTFKDIYITFANYIQDMRPWDERKAGGPLDINCFQPRHPMEQNVYDAIIQGEVQRAIATKDGWYFSVVKFSEHADRYHALVEPPLKPQYQCDGPSPCHALLAAYIAALEAQP